MSERGGAGGREPASSPGLAVPRLQLLHDPGCPAVDLARARLREALLRLGAPPLWEEAGAAEAGRGSPTLLIDGVDPWAEGERPAGARCRLYDREAAPTVDALVAALTPAVAAASASLVLVRHGETVGLSSIRLYGATDIALSEVGEAQMARAADALRGHRADRLVASSLCRSSRGAAIVREALAAPPPPLLIATGLRERDFGRWEGWTVDEVAARDPAGYAAWTTQGLDFAFPGGEPRRAVVERVRAAVEDELVFPGEGRSVAVLHKGIIKVVLANLLGLDFEASHRLPVALGSIHVVERIGGRWRLCAQNLTRHLGELDLGG